LGKGLGALISDDGKSTADMGSYRRELRKKRSELKELLEDIEVQKKEVEELRKDLTIQLMLEGKVDKTRLFELEEEMKLKFDTKEKLELDIEDLEIELKGNYTIHSPHSDERSTEETAPKNVSSLEIDLRMVKDLMFLEDGTLVDDEPPVEEAVADLEGHMRDLKEELNSEMEAEKVRKETYGDVDPITEPPTALALVDGAAPEGTGNTSAVPKKAVKLKPVRRRKKEPTKVQPVLRRKVKERTKKDAGLYEMIDRAQQMMGNNDVAGAKNILHHGLRDYPLDDELLYHLGNAFFMEGDLDSAEIRFNKAVESNPNSYRAYNNLGVVLKKKGEREDAIQAFNQALELNEEYERAWLNLGMVFMEIEPPMLNEAKIFLRRALECDPDLQPAREKLDLVKEAISQGS